jgi:hypothetical protein
MELIASMSDNFASRTVTDALMDPHLHFPIICYHR